MTSLSLLTGLLIAVVHSAVGESPVMPDINDLNGRRPYPLTPDPCEEVTQCVESSAALRSMMGVLGRFNIGGIYSASESWCTGHPFRDCWSTSCTDSSVRRHFQMTSRFLERICQDRDTFRAAAACYESSLGPRLSTCFHNLEGTQFEPTSGGRREIFTRLQTCGNDVIDSLSPACSLEHKEFLKSFFESSALLASSAYE